MSTIQCLSVRSASETGYQCLLKAKPGFSYCSMHLIQKTKIDYAGGTDEATVDADIEIPAINPVIKKAFIKDIVAKPKALPIPKPVTTETNGILREQKVSTICSHHMENETELEIKLLILANDDEYTDKISELIGPVFADITLSEDQQDPVTLDPIWVMKHGIKHAANVNKYYLFSYTDSQGKIRCLTVFTLWNMIQSNNFVHPITTEVMPAEDIERAHQLVALYTEKIGLFQADAADSSPEFVLRNRLVKLFSKFHMHSIYFEEDWLLSITNITQLDKIIKETGQFVHNNIGSVNPALKGKGFKLFQRRIPTAVQGQKRGFKVPRGSVENSAKNLIHWKEYIVSEWEKLIAAADTPQNQIPIWIIASGLSFVAPEIKTKYPDLEIML